MRRKVFWDTDWLVQLLLEEPDRKITKRELYQRVNAARHKAEWSKLTISIYTEYTVTPNPRFKVEYDPTTRQTVFSLIHRGY
jgi:hypothetical protein